MSRALLSTVPHRPILKLLSYLSAPQDCEPLRAGGTALPGPPAPSLDKQPHLRSARLQHPLLYRLKELEPELLCGRLFSYKEVKPSFPVG